jgi:hypothetical protein
MSTSTKIEWTRGDDGSGGATWNPVTGCNEVSEGCDHCYAKTFAERVARWGIRSSRASPWAPWLSGGSPPQVPVPSSLSVPFVGVPALCQGRWPLLGVFDSDLAGGDAALRGGGVSCVLGALVRSVPARRLRWPAARR